MTARTAGIWISDPDAYRRKLFDLVGPRDPIEVMAQTAGALERIVRDCTTAQMQSRPFPDQWSPNEVLGHLVDSEWVYGFRIRYIYCEREPAILGTDQDVWVARQRYNERPPMELVEQFRLLRRATLELWRRMTPDDLERRGRHNERGMESPGTMCRMMAGHDLSHLDQIVRCLAAVQNQL